MAMTPALLGKKIGMTRVYNEKGAVVPVTVVQAEPNVITQIKTADGKDGYHAVQIGFNECKPKFSNFPLIAHCAKAGVAPRRHFAEIRLKDATDKKAGDSVNVAIFEGVKFVDVIGTSKGKGTAGVMKRHGFHGLGASHGTQRKHRAPGSIGACATPARVFKGTRMAGRLGGVRTTTLSLTVQAVDADKGLLLIRGAVPGPTGGLVLVRTAVKAGPTKGVSA